MKFILTISLTLLLTACTSNLITARNSQLGSIRTGSIITLNQPLTIPALRVRTSIQDGETSPNIDPSEPFCDIEVNSFSDSVTILPAGNYKITRVLQYENPFHSNKPSGKTMVASSDNTAAWKTLAQSPDSIWHYTTAFRLESNLHPDIRQLECGTVFDSGYFARHITINEFETLVGDLISLQAVVK